MPSLVDSAPSETFEDITDESVLQKNELSKSVEIFEFIAERIDEAGINASVKQITSVDIISEGDTEDTFAKKAVRNIENRRSYLELDDQDGKQNNVLVNHKDLEGSLSVIVDASTNSDLSNGVIEEKGSKEKEPKSLPASESKFEIEKLQASIKK